MRMRIEMALLILFAAGAQMPGAATTTPIPLAAARHAFEETRLASEEDGGRLWGKALYGPLLFVDPATRFVVANVADGNGALRASDGVWIGTLPPQQIIANTAIEWSGTRWTMVLWTALSDKPAAQRRLLLHESFHRLQNELGFAAIERTPAHLDTITGRYWLLLEFRALSAALRATDDQRSVPLQDALLFRTARRTAEYAAAAPAVVSETPTSRERALESNEGLAEYTGFALRGTANEESRLTLARRIDGLDLDTSFVRSFAYQTGPAYGLLLDALSPGWAKKFRASDDLATAAARAAHIDESSDVAAEAAQRALVYGGAELRAREERRETEQRAHVANLRHDLVDGPLLELPMVDARFSFDPNQLIPLGDDGNAYPLLDVTASWGTLHAERGARINADFSRIAVAAPPPPTVTPAPSKLSGDGWSLTLADGWSLAAGARSGDLCVVRK